jgi:hypothetical protein
VGAEHAASLVDIWMLSDEAMRRYPDDVPMSTFAFPWFRLWVRPFVPDIDALSESDRAYYERFLLATFNNPARIDLNADMLWTYLSVEGAADRKTRIDANVLPPLARALRAVDDVCRMLTANQRAREVFDDLRDRLLAGRAYLTTMRNSMAWTEAVHGYMKGKTQLAKDHYRSLCGSMIDSELQNTRELLLLWQRSTRDVIPISASGETLHIYGDNFGELLEKKIALMGHHRDDEPRVDKEYMWRGRKDA